jgi:hypothetical protein
MLRSLEGRSEGDPRKIAEVIVQLANSDEVPVRLILGVDAEKRMQQAQAARAARLRNGEISLFQRFLKMGASTADCIRQILDLSAMHWKITRQRRWNLRRASDEAIPPT